MPNTKKLLSWTLLVLLMSLNGCASHLPTPPPSTPVQVPAPPPELMQAPTSSTSYSEHVHKLLSDWLARLTDWKRGS